MKWAQDRLKGLFVRLEARPDSNLKARAFEPEPSLVRPLPLIRILTIFVLPRGKSGRSDFSDSRCFFFSNRNRSDESSDAPTHRRSNAKNASKKFVLQNLFYLDSQNLVLKIKMVAGKKNRLVVRIFYDDLSSLQRRAAHRYHRYRSYISLYQGDL